MINNRQNGRRRGRGGPRPQNGSAPSQGGGSRIDNRARGNAAQLLEKYKSLARDAQMQGDRVMTEYYFQFADHYFRILAENRPRMEEGQARRFQDERDEDRDDGGQDDGYDEVREDRPREQRMREDRPREDRPREDRPRGDQFRDERPREDRFRDEQPRDDRARDDRPREDRPRVERPRREFREERSRRPEQAETRPYRQDDELPLAAAEPAVQPERPRRIEVVNEPAPRIALPDPVEPVATEDTPAPRRRGRPRKDAAAPAETGAGERIDADRLPPAVSIDPAPGNGAANDAGEAEAPAPRRRTRRPRSDAAAIVEA